MTIKSHAHQFDKIAERFGWDNKTKADEFILTLRGQARKIAEALPADVTNDYQETKKQIIDSFSKEKPAALQMRDWSNFAWRSEKQTIVEFATLLKAKLNKIGKRYGQTSGSSEMFLKNRLIEAIDEERPAFAKYIKLNRDDTKHDSYDKLYRFIQEKWDIYKSEEDADDEREGTNILFTEETMKPKQQNENYQQRNGNYAFGRNQDAMYMNRSYQRVPGYPFYRNVYNRSYRDAAAYPANNGRQSYYRNEFPPASNQQQMPSNYGYGNVYQNRYPRYNNPYQNRQNWYGYQPQNQWQMVQQPMTYTHQPDPYARNIREQRMDREYRDQNERNAGERKTKEKTNKDLAYINRGTKVEPGQKVQFLEQAKNNQKN